MRPPALLVAASLVAACVQVEPPAMPAENACGAAALQGLVGQPSAVLATMRFSQPVRVIRPGMAVTMDYLAERLNVEVDGAGNILRVFCG